MATKIRGDTTDSTKMLLGQIRRVFDPDWLQGFERGAFTVQFMDGTPAEDELLAFADMYGFDLQSKENGSWERYYFS